MTQRLPNGGKGVRFWYFARGSAQCAGCCTGVSTCGRFSESRLATGIQSVKKGTTIGSRLPPVTPGRAPSGRLARLPPSPALRSVEAMGALRRAVSALARQQSRAFASNVNQTYGLPTETFKRKVRETARGRSRGRTSGDSSPSPPSPRDVSSSRRAAPTKRRGDRGDEGWEAHRANPKSARFFAPSPIVHLSESGLSAYAFRARESTEERR